MGFLSGSVDAVDDTLGGRYDEVEDVDAEDVEVVRLGALMDASGADASLIVSSSSSAWLNASDSMVSRSVRPETLSTSDSSSSGTEMCSNTDAALSDDVDRDDEEVDAAFAVRSFRMTSLVFVRVHWSVISHARLRGVMPVGISSRAPWSDNVCVV